MNTKKNAAVIFDCDGVMFDSRRANINFYNHLLAHFDLPPMSKDDVEYVYMHTADESVRRIFAGSPHLKEAQDYRIKMDYSPFIKDMDMEPGLKECLTRLRPDFGLAVATNRSNTIGKVLECNGLGEIFDIVVSSLDVKRPKPHPESLLKILDFFGIGPLDSIYVGDSIVDYKTAKAAGVPFIAFKNQGLHAAYHADRLEDIAEKILR